jgi:glyceraldehyde 3-phosphate dehydrogenase
MKVAINGFGRIGRTLTRLLLEQKDVDLVAVNDLADITTLAHLFRYDSINGKYQGTVERLDSTLCIADKSIQFFSMAQWDMLPWNDMDIDIVIDCSGKIKSSESAELHIKAGAKKVLISAPVDDERIPLFVLGVTDSATIQQAKVISNASCTTNNAAPMIQILDKHCQIESCYITTVHSYTTDQRLHDAPHNDLRRSRAAALSIIPTTTGAAKALTRVFPHLADKMGGCGMRVPVPNGSLTDITCLVRSPRTVEEINAIFKSEANAHYKNIVEYTNDPIVGADVLKNAHSCVFDAQLTSVIGPMIKVVGWYDNEYGYSNRLLDVLKLWTTS